MAIKTKEDLKRDMLRRQRQKQIEKREKIEPPKKTLGGFLTNLKTDLSQFSKGILSIGRKFITDPKESAGKVFDLAMEVDKRLPGAAMDFAKEAGGLLAHPVESTKKFLDDFDKMRSISYNDQKKAIDESLQSITSSKQLNANQKLLAQFGTVIIGDITHEVTHPAEFMYDKPFTFGLDLLSTGGGKVVGKGVKLTRQMAKDTKFAKAMSDVFIPNAKLKRAGYNKFAEDLSKTSSNIFNMQEGIIKTTAKKFEKEFNLSGKERLEFFETIDALRREDQILKSTRYPDMPPIKGDLAKTRKGMTELGTKEMKAKNLNPQGKFFRDKFDEIWEAQRVFAEKAKPEIKMFKRDGFKNQRGVLIDQNLSSNVRLQITDQLTDELKALGIDIIEIVPKTQTGIEYGQRVINGKKYGIIKIGKNAKIEQSVIANLFRHEAGHGVYFKLTPDEKAFFKNHSIPSGSEITHRARIGKQLGQEAESFADFVNYYLSGNINKIPIKIRPLVIKYANVTKQVKQGVSKAKSKNPKIQKAIDWWLDTEVPKIQKAAGLPDEYKITNYLHHVFPEKVSSAEKTVRPIRAKRGFLKKSKDVAGYSKDPIVSISAIKIKIALANIKDAFIRRTGEKYAKPIKDLETRLFGEIGPEKFNLLKKTGKITDEIKKKYKVDSFVKNKKEVLWLPKEIADELNKVWGNNPMTNIIQKLLSPLDFFNRNWKPLATAVRPRYHTRNVVGNLYNSIVIGGMNPANIPKAARQQLAGYINEARKTKGTVGQIAKKFFPDRINDKYLRYALKDDIIGRGFFSIDLHDLSKTVNFSEDIIKTINRVKEPAEIYKIPILKQYLNLSKHIGQAVEDNARLSLYINQLKKGSSRAAAKQYVNKHLFDYLQGLGEGDKIIKRFIPFWSWQRFNTPLQVESVFTKSRRMAAIQHGVEGEIRSKELADPNLQFMSEKEIEAGQFKIGTVKQNGKIYDKYMRTQSVLPQADLIQLVDYFRLQIDDVGINPVFSLLQRLEKNINYWGNEIEKFTGEKGLFLNMSLGKKEIEMMKVIPILNEINKLIGGSDIDKAPLPIRLEQVLSPLGISLKDPEQVKYFGLLKEEQELKGSFESGLESLYTKYYSKLRNDPEQKMFKENVQTLEKLLLDKGVSQHSLLPLKIKAIKRSIKDRMNKRVGEKIDEKGEKLNLKSIQLKVKDFFEPEAGEVRVRDVTRELWELITPDIAQNKEQASAMGYKPASASLVDADGYGLYISPDGLLVTINKDGGFGIDAFGAVAIGSVGKTAAKEGIKQVLKPSVYQGFKDISTNLLRQLEGKFRVSKQFVTDLLKKKGMKAAEIDIIKEVLEEYPGRRLPVDEFANKVKQKLLPLEEGISTKWIREEYRYADISLPDNLRGNISKYKERIYESPIKTSAGGIHFDNEIKNYFAHTRIEDMATSKLSKEAKFKLQRMGAKYPEYSGGTRRVIELQSDLFQRGRLAGETLNQRMALQKRVLTSVNTKTLIGEKVKLLDNKFQSTNKTGIIRKISDDNSLYTIQIDGTKLGGKIEDFSWDMIDHPFIDNLKAKLQPEIDIIKQPYARLEPYRNIWHERIIREEIKKAGEDGMKKLQFPTGKTAMQVEGLIGEEAKLFINAGTTRARELTLKELKINQKFSFANSQDKWIITKIDDELIGTFKAVPESKYDEVVNKFGKQDFLKNTKVKDLLDSSSESFNLSLTVDATDPIYKFYETTVQKYLKKIKPEMKQITDAQGVEWFEILITKADATSPVDAFSKFAIPSAMIGEYMEGVDIDEDGKEVERTPESITGFLKHHPAIEAMKEKEAQAQDDETKSNNDTKKELEEKTDEDREEVIVSRSFEGKQIEVDVNDLDELKRIYQVNKDWGEKATIGDIDLTTHKYATNPDHVKSISQIYEQVGEYTIEEMENEFKRLGSQLQYITEDLEEILTHFDITPGEFIAVVRQDSGAGTTGAGAKTKNPGNIGNVDDGSTIQFGTWIEGSTAAIRNLAERKVKSDI